MSGSSSFIEVDWCQMAKRGQVVSGDVLLCQKIKDEERVVVVLSDGLGSGIKASVLANLTATMALKYACRVADIRRSAGIIMETLPVCSVRKISYSTFTIVDMDSRGDTRIIEFDNPPYVLLRGGLCHEVEKTSIRLDKWYGRTVRYSRFNARAGDRIVFFSDGVSQAGMGEYRTPLGWGLDGVRRFLLEETAHDTGISARTLAQRLAAKAEAYDVTGPKDDITCGVIYYREPRRLLVVTGPPFSPARDREMALAAAGFAGRKVIAGGTTANIVARILKRQIRMDLGECDPEIPPPAYMDGVDLITEGTLTLGRVAALLESGADPETLPRNAARMLLEMLLSSDIVQFLVGTRVNQAHQDPNIPVELELRRSLVKRIAAQLESRHVKQTHIRYL